MSGNLPSVHLNPDRDYPVKQGHPWVFASAIKEVRGDPQRGEVVDIYSHEGDFLARGAYSPDSRIRARIWSWDEEDTIDADFVRARILKAIIRRDRLIDDPSVSAYREVHAESDLVPGLIVDRYADIRVLQFLSASAEYFREAIIDFFRTRGDCLGIYERSDADVRALEGLTKRSGHVWGIDPAQPVEIEENGLRFLVDITRGHKTGFYLDQRENRRSIGHLIRGGEVLDCFSYSGSFSAIALQAGADNVTAIDSSGDAVKMAERILDLNGLPRDRFTPITGDAFAELRRFRDSRRSFDFVILDPPRLAPTTSHVSKASRAYKDINRLAFKLLRPGGF
jgi:23S rRNA (cytosine1962-C5)-methyltransferase